MFFDNLEYTFNLFHFLGWNMIFIFIFISQKIFSSYSNSILFFPVDIIYLLTHLLFVSFNIDFSLHLCFSSISIYIYFQFFLSPPRGVIFWLLFSLLVQSLLLPPALSNFYGYIFSAFAFFLLYISPFFIRNRNPFCFSRCHPLWYWLPTFFILFLYIFFCNIKIHIFIIYFSSRPSSCGFHYLFHFFFFGNWLSAFTSKCFSSAVLAESFTTISAYPLLLIKEPRWPYLSGTRPVHSRLLHFPDSNVA